MNWGRLVLHFIVGSVLSGLVFCTASFATFCWYVSPWSGFRGYQVKVGWPVEYYDRFLLDGAIHHGFEGKVFLLQVLGYWVVVTGGYILSKWSPSSVESTTDALDAPG